MPVFVGCDLGTMGSKAAVVSDAGVILAEAYEEVPMTHPRAGWAEQDSLQIEASAHRVIRQALTASGRDDVAAVAFSGQMSGIGTIDRHFNPATHYDSWLDARCEPYIEQMREHADQVTAISGCPPTYSHGPKILWWRGQRPEVYAGIAKFLPISSFVAARAAGLSADDAFVDDTHLHYSNLADTARGVWSAELLDQFGVDADILPRIVRPTQVIGEITSAAAATTGLPSGTPIAAGAGDTAAACLGAGAVVPGRAFDAAGTASVFAMCVDGFQPDLQTHTLLASRGIVPGTFVNLAFVNGGGLALRWFRDHVAKLSSADAYRQLDELAAEVPAGSEGCMWYPHLQGRVLPPSPNARGGWIGLTSRHERGHLFRAMLEGIALEYAEWARLCGQVGGTRLTEVRAVGGGAASRLWNQIKADVLGINWVPVVGEGGALGTALVAAAASGHVTDLARTIEIWQTTRESFEPNQQVHQRYQTVRRAYRVVAEALSEVYEQLPTES